MYFNLLLVQVVVNIVEKRFLVIMLEEMCCKKKWYLTGA
jgi:hypothetical protein